MQIKRFAIRWLPWFVFLLVFTALTWGLDYWKQATLIIFIGIYLLVRDNGHGTIV